ncbi:MAG TPA: hypothetical protein VMS53_06245 [Burkholderiales bacterium]|nr:hypothetical protein [Burkholderiales bacterium]
MKSPCALVAALVLAAGASAAEPPSPAVQQAIALPKGHAAGLACVTAFVADAKASGLVAQSVARAGLRGVNVAP